MKVVDVGQSWIVGIAPAFRIKMQTEYEIRMQFEVHQRRLAADLAVAVKQNFALPANGLLFLWAVCVKNLRSGPWHAIFDQNLFGKFLEVAGAFCGDRVVTVPNEENFRAELTQSRGQQARHAQSQIAFFDWLTVANLKPALLHLCPFSAKMSGVERNPQTREWLIRFRRWQRLCRSPKTRHGLARGVVLRKAQREKLLRLPVHQNPRCLLIYFDQVGCESMCAINILD